ncbi:hypothetical protein JG688_00005033 [Phytophthora aleatoria]|uniref:DUF4460 domain-containing protein n=1 Tax=Phytophthora aleatoria TaxID=2496075 RepID=A0A8J5M8W6_9STRA|nr:hypothetical protein JG688_00005033 [Phytophthora aleatoria]
MAKRSSTLKQFLLRIHPDHFRNIPKVHDENLHSVKLLNQFMDEHYAPQSGAGSTNWRRLGTPKEKVYFSVMVPSLSANARDEEAKKLKRFPLELAANIEAKMISVLRECGVSVEQSVEEALAASGAASQQRRAQKRGERRPDDWRRDQEGGWKRPSGMDFGGFTMGDMYAKANRAAAASASRRRKKPIQTLTGLLEYMKEDDTIDTQQRRRIAWQSIQSVRGTLKRELGLEDMLYSCGWSTMHLNTTAMILLQTLRKYARANKQGIFSPKDFLRGATIDISANPSGIDFSNEYRIELNPADVPVQWVQVLETIDANMVLFMKAARESLISLQTDATAALGEANISRGLLEKFILVIEDESYDWRVLETGEVRAPFTSSYGEAVTFLSRNRSQIRRQQEAHNANLEAFAYISSRCADTMHVKSITRDEGIPVADAIVACEELLKAVVGMTPQSSRGSLPHEMVRFLDTYTQGRSICISCTYGLVLQSNILNMEEELRELRLELKVSDIYTLSKATDTDTTFIALHQAARNDVKRYASYALRLQQELTREKQKIVELGKEEDAGFPHLNGKYIEPAEAFAWDKKVDKSRTEHGAWSRKIDQVAKMLDEKRGEAVAAKEKDATRENQVGESVENVIQSLEAFLKQQERLIGEIGRENAKLRDMLRARPTRRELVVSWLIYCTEVGEGN